MTKNIRLISPNLDCAHSYAAALREGHRCGNNKVAAASDILNIETSPQGFLDKLYGTKPATRINEKGEEVELVPETTLWLVEENAFIGDAKIRHRLNARLEQSGGHIRLWDPPVTA